VTPYHADGSVNFEQLEAVTERQIENGVNGVIPMGTTGECFAVSDEEHKSIIACTVAAAAGRVPVVAGTASSSTAQTMKLTAQAKEAGADACLVATPYFNKPGQEGMFLHYEQVATVGLPITMYNVPGRTNIAMTPATVARLSEIPEVIAIKEATANMDVASEIRKRCGITILSGDDSLALPLMSVGGSGVMSVAANLVPAELSLMCKKGLAGDYDGAREIHLKLFPLFQAMVAEVNPIPVKAGTELLGICPGSLRLPLTPATDATRASVQKALSDLNML
jgi:4-hydroxy-tetrahydrodipicolinate synthase